jgi:hypothetical protein
MRILWLARQASTVAQTLWVVISLLKLTTRNKRPFRRKTTELAQLVDADGSQNEGDREADHGGKDLIVFNSLPTSYSAALEMYTRLGEVGSFVHKSLAHFRN